MPNTSLEDKIKLFNTKYNVKFDPHAVAEEARIDDVLDGFRFDQQDPKVKQASNYLKTLFETLSDSLNAQTQINATGYYDLSDFNIVKFVNEFEEIMAQRNAESKEPKERKPFEGMNFEKLIEKTTAKTKEYDKTLYSIWANKVVDGKISFKTLKKITDESIRNIERQERENRPISREDLTNIVLAHEAMFRVSQSRGFFWKLFNFFREDRYLDSLSNKRMEYVNKNYPVQDILDKIPDSVMKETYTNTKYALNHINEKKYEVKRQAEEKKAEE
ncbi:MAG: hypothetical protein J6V68_04135, partial [Clostridia bacterium]|nr:hypothetical protein [Clostridia bacterium]